MLTERDRRASGPRSGTADRMFGALRGLLATRNAKPTMVTIADYAREATGAAFAAAVLDESAGPAVAALAGANGDEATARRGILEGFGDAANPWGAVLRTGKALVIPDMHRDLRFGVWARHGPDELRSMVVVPLLDNGRPIGTLGVYFEDSAGAGPEVLDLLMYLTAPKPSNLVSNAVAAARCDVRVGGLEETDRLKTELLGTVAHELRAPIQATLGFADTMLTHWDRMDDDHRKQLLRRVLVNAEEQANLVDGLLDFARLEVGNPTVEARPCELRAEVQSRIANLGRMFDAHRVRLLIPAGLSVQTDPEILTTILTNLLGNAVKFSPPGTKIEISARSYVRTAVVSVSDEGPGIEPEERSDVFEPFRQLGSSSDGGAGLGLALVRRRVELLGGRIWLESRPGPGATFSFSLPLAVADPS